MPERDDVPRRWRKKLDAGQEHPNGGDRRYSHGCYFPVTDLCVGEMGRPGTGVPAGVEWLDEPSELMRKMMK